MADSVPTSSESNEKDVNATQPAEDKKSPKSSPSKIETNEALQHLVQGKRHLLVRDIHSAVNSLQEACRLLAEQYGETEDPCGEAYFYYGKALLELSRMETGVLGNALDGDSTEGDEEDGSGDDNDAAEGEADGEEAEAKDGEEEEKDGEEGEKDGEGDEGSQEGDTSQECDTEEGEGDGDGAKEGDDEEDVPNIQLAWEVLELAKVIFTRQAKDKASFLKLSEVYQKLGEVSIEAENYTQAVSDLNSCLEIQKEHLPEDDRLIAETYYHLGVAHSLANEYSEAIASFQASVSTIQARVERLQKQIVDRDQGTKIEHDDPFYKEENEIKELEELLPDINEKIADMREMKSEAQRKLAELFSGGAGPSTSAAPISPVKAMMTSRPATAAEPEGEQKEARSISHLVKRKRLSDGADDETKRPKQENGHCDKNGHADGAKET